MLLLLRPLMLVVPSSFPLTQHKLLLLGLFFFFWVFWNLKFIYGFLVFDITLHVALYSFILDYKHFDYLQFCLKTCRLHDSNSTGLIILNFNVSTCHFLSVSIAPFE